MTDPDPILTEDDATLARALYPDSPTAPEPVTTGDEEDAETARLFYPDGAAPPLRKRMPSDAPDPEVEASDDARSLYGGEEKPEPRQKWKESPKPKPEEQVAEPTAEEVGEADTDSDAGEDAGEAPAFDESAYDAEVVSSYREAATELGIEDTAAQRLLERMGPRLAERQAQQLDALRDEWVEQARSDPDINDYAGFESNIKTARSVVERFGGDELREVLDQSGLGDHPALVRTFLRIGRRLGEDAQR